MEDARAFRRRSGIPLAHYQPLVFDLTRLLCLRSIAATRAGDHVKACEALRIALKINEASIKEPFLIGELFAKTVRDGSTALSGNCAMRG